MSFKGNSALNSNYDNEKTQNLIDNTKDSVSDNIMSLLDKISVGFLDFIKIYDSIVNYNKILSTSHIDVNFIKGLSEEMKVLIKEFPKITMDISKDFDKIRSITKKNEIEYELKAKITDAKKLYNDKILPKQDELASVIYRIMDIENSIFKKINKDKFNSSMIEIDDGYIDINQTKASFRKTQESKTSRMTNSSSKYSEIKVNTDYSNDNSNLNDDEIFNKVNQNFSINSEDDSEQIQIQKQKDKEDLDETNASIQDLKFKQNISNAREKELSEINKVSSQIKEMTNYIKSKTILQKNMLSKLIFLYRFN